MTIIPEGYASQLTLRETEVAIKRVKDFIQVKLAQALNLTRVSAPLFVRPETGLNDNLSGTERPVSFGVKALGGARCEIVHSLAKWKRMALDEYGFGPGEGLYTDMNAIRRDEAELDNLHSVYVDQWDWEKHLPQGARNEETLRDTVRGIYGVLREAEAYVCGEYPQFSPYLPPEIAFVTAQQLEDEWPRLTPHEREYRIAKRHGAVFIMQVGKRLASGQVHDLRAPDYDDWTLNGDIFVFDPVLDCAMELSSMGIRVDRQCLLRQLQEAGCMERAELPFHRLLLADRLPPSIGGGIGQSRVCMLLLRKAHIGEVHASVWPEETRRICAEHRVALL